MNGARGQEAESAEERKGELRRKTKEIENQVSEALFRKSTFSVVLLEEILELYPLEASLIQKVRNLQGAGLHQMRLKLFELFAKTGKTVSDEVLSKRISELILKHLASMPRGGRPRKAQE